MRIKEYKEIRKLTVQQLADLAGLPKRTLEDIIKRDDCLVSNAIKIAKALNVTLDELCGLNDERKLRLMKFYQIITISMKNNEPGDEFTVWEGFDYEEALKQKEKAEQAFNTLSDYDKKHQVLEARVYDLELTENPDADEINDAIIDSLGYNEF